MAKSRGDDKELQRACEAAIEGTKQKVVMSIRVAKSQGAWGKGKFGSKAHDKGGQTKVFLHVLKYTNGEELEPAKIYKLKRLAKVEVLTNDTSGCTFMLGFDNIRNQRVAPIQWTMRNLDDRNRLLVCILHTCKDALGHLPKVVGVDIVELALWAKEHASEGSKQQNLKDGSAGDVLSEVNSAVENDLVSQAEEEDMEALLGTYVMGIGEAELFSERLKRELHALEAANVHAILETEHLVDERGQLKKPDNADLHNKCRVYVRLLHHLKILDSNCLAPLRKAYCSSLNQVLRREAREFANELRAGTKAPKVQSVWFEGPSPNQNVDTSMISEAYSKMVAVFIPLFVDESSFLAFLMRFEVSSDDDLDMEADENGTKGTLEMGALNESLRDLLDGIQEDFYATVDWAHKIDDGQ